MKKLLSLALVLVLALSMMVSVSAEEAEATTPTIAEAMASDRWVTVNRWDFNGDVTDSVGGVVATLVTGEGYAAPTFEDGYIKMTGTTAYKFDKALTFQGEGFEDLKYLRVDVKGYFDWDSTLKGAHRIFGSNTDLGYATKTSGLYFSNIQMAEYGSGCGIGMQTDSQNGAQGFYITVDQTKLDVTSDAEHLYSCVYYDAMCYFYVDGVLIAEKAFPYGGAYYWNEFLGCSWAKNIGWVGTIDYIDVSMFGPEKAADDDTTGGDTSDDNADTGFTLIVLPVALVAATGVVVTAKKRK